jgi:hypothetical protein
MGERLEESIRNTQAEARAMGERLEEAIRNTQAEARAMEERLVEVIRDSQTEVIRSTFGFANSMDSKLKTSEAVEILLRQRVGILESRMLDVEKRLNMPPAA